MSYLFKKVMVKSGLMWGWSMRMHRVVSGKLVMWCGGVVGQKGRGLGLQHGVTQGQRGRVGPAQGALRKGSTRPHLRNHSVLIYKSQWKKLKLHVYYSVL